MNDIYRKTERELLNWRPLNETLLRYMKGEENLIGKLIEGSLPLRDLDILLPPKKEERKIDAGQVRMNEIYAAQIRQGYKFRTNADVVDAFYPQCSLSNLIKKYEEKGFDVFVGDKAFSTDGTEYPDRKAVFVKKIDGVQ